MKNIACSVQRVACSLCHCEEAEGRRSNPFFEIASSLALLAMTIVFSLPVFALELPEGAKEYYSDKASTASGSSEGIGPTQEAGTQQIKDMGKRETKEYDLADESAAALTIKAWEALNNMDADSINVYTSRCIELYEQKAKEETAGLNDFAAIGSEAKYPTLNDVAACYFIRAEFYKLNRDWENAKANYRTVVDSFWFAQYWDPRGWWWKPGEISKAEIEKIDTGYYEEKK